MHKIILEISLRVETAFVHDSEIRAAVIRKEEQVDFLLKWWCVVLLSGPSHLSVLLIFLLTHNFFLLAAIFLIMTDAWMCSVLFSLFTLFLHWLHYLWFRILYCLKSHDTGNSFERLLQLFLWLFLLFPQASRILCLNNLVMALKFLTRLYYKMDQPIDSSMG